MRDESTSEFLHVLNDEYLDIQTRCYLIIHLIKIKVDQRFFMQYIRFVQANVFH